ncbi:hypothetical protein D0469_12885 [Peribacillus saganii]|uniref:WVELL protein n=1 Tax=Peribacillus saganii TaxID=2303992 RepID=A0A372LMM6_9BACI|nr:YfhJ family protein [Peribacillus saganii]RFU68157.1 hypothetical protein D0469_12885 [Peribacillus saganii]
MEEYRESLKEMLLKKNKNISNSLAQTWVDLLWEDFEATYAKAGHDYAGSEMTLRVVKQWIENYGDKLHEFIATNPKYKHLLEEKDNKPLH